MAGLWSDCGGAAPFSTPQKPGCANLSEHTDQMPRRLWPYPIADCPMKSSISPPVIVAGKNYSTRSGRIARPKTGQVRLNRGDVASTIKQIEGALRRCGVNLSTFYAQSSVSRSTVCRWKNGSEPQEKTWARLIQQFRMSVEASDPGPITIVG
jgi:hypothetical protein